MRNAWLLVLIGCSSPTTPEKSPPPLPCDPAPAPVAQVHASAPEREPIAPWSLTASDGSGLELSSIDAKAVVEGPLAFTELHLRFRNPEDRVREGTFAITLPERAAVSRFAMVEDGKVKEAEVVAKALARRAYDDAIHRGIDPAILEKGAGNQFTARVFPIPASGTKEIVLSFSQELTGAGYVLPLTGFPSIDDVSVTFDTAGLPRQELKKKHWQPDHDFFAEVDKTTAVASGGLIAASFDVSPTGDAAADPPSALTILVDTSASRAPGFAHYVARVRKLINTLAVKYPRLTVDVLAFDQETRAEYRGLAESFGDTEVAAIVEQRADGASDLGQALANVSHAARVVVITDGVVTAGLDTAPLAAAFKQQELARVDVILAGGIRDDAAAKMLTRAGARAGDVFDLDSEIAPIAKGLGEAVRIDVAVAVPGATWWSPHVIPSVRAGTQVMVYARLPSPRERLAALIGGSAHTVAIRQGTPAFVERSAARIQIDELETQLAAATIAPTKAALSKQIETMSIASRVASSQATMLILDNEAEYARYNIDRKALVDILVVGAHGLEQGHRSYVKFEDRSNNHGKGSVEGGLLGSEDGESSGEFGFGRTGIAYGGGDTGWGEIGVGSYGTIAHGSGTGTGFGVGGGYGGMRGRTASVPTISIGQPMVQGSLDKNIIRRYIRRNLEKVTYCYERELLAHPEVHGTIATKIVIGPQGTVLDATATGFDDAVASCVAGVLKQTEFPSSGETIIVNYPFTFRTAETPTEDPAPATATATAQTFTTPESPATVVEVRVAAPPAVKHVAVAPTPAPPVAAPSAIVSPVAAPHVAPTPPTPAPVAPAEVAEVPEPAPSAVPAYVAPQPEIAAGPAIDAQAAAYPELSRQAPPMSDMPRFNPAMSALRGKLATVMRTLAKRDVAGALGQARAWRDEQPTDVLAIVGLGEAYEAAGLPLAAARVYGSLIDLYPSRADYRRFAGERLERLGSIARALQIDTYRRAVTDRPDQITGHRLLAYALLRNDDYAGAFDAIIKGADEHPPSDRFLGADDVFKRDVGMIATAYLAHGGDAAHITKALNRRGIAPFTQRSTRVMLYWETDANDVDLHVRDARGGHSWYSHKELESGGALYADITTGYGPECFEIVGTPSAGPYDIGVHYYRQGPMGYGMGLLQIVRFDGKAFTFDDRPYMIMRDEAYVSLGKMR
ncbi:MAG TPA: VIT domain-containing protein [Kofleriaceae bacterium]|jgi:hypothetical protein